jgi:N-acetylmuramoyl-L-alanine amidase
MHRLSSPTVTRPRTWLRVLGTFALLSVLAGASLNALPASSAARKEQAREQFDKAEQMREALNGRPADQRARKDYQRVADAYRKVYYVAPASSKADASAVAVAEILADMGRQFQPDERDFQAAISQYEFLRREYPGSKYRFQALFTIGQIYKEDLGDDDAARQTFEEFLKHYPRNSLAPEAKQALAELNQPKPSKQPVEEAHTEKDQAPTPEPASLSTTKKKSGLAMVTGIRHWSTPDYTRVAIDVDSEVKYEAGRVPNPDRIFFDLPDTKLASVLVGKSFDVQDGFLKKIRVAQYQPGSTRVVLEVADVSDYSAFLLPNPYRLIIDIHGRQPQSPTQVARANAAAPPGSNDRTVTAIENEKPYRSVEKANEAGKSNSASGSNTGFAKTASPANVLAGKPGPTSSQPTRSAAPVSSAKAMPHKVVVDDDEDDGSSDAAPVASSANSRAPGSKTSKPVDGNASISAGSATDSTVAQKASSKPKQTTAVATAKPPDPLFSGPGDTSGPELKATTQPTTAPTAVAVAPRSTNKKTTKATTANVPATHEAEPTSSGDRSLTRALGLKIGRIVVDAGHGGHDTGTIGPNGLLEKDLVLDVALRLGRLLETRLGADVIYTREDDTFIPLETRTAIANEHQADLFISVHANSSSDPSARGVETYYLNFTSNPDALEVAARENAVSEKSIFELQDLVKKITLKDKIDESRELATDVQQCLYTGLATRHSTLRDRGVKKAPFVVLIGANMPSILAEISFVSNPTDEAKLETPEYRQKIAESLYKGIAKYADGLSGVKVAAKFSKQDGQ